MQPTFPLSSNEHSMTMADTLCSQTILQKSLTVFCSGPWVRMNWFRRKYPYMSETIEAKDTNHITITYCVCVYVYNVHVCKCTYMYKLQRINPYNKQTQSDS